MPDTYVANAVSTSTHTAPQPQQSTKVFLFSSSLNIDTRWCLRNLKLCLQVHATGFLQHRVGEEAYLNQLIGLKVFVDIQNKVRLSLTTSCPMDLHTFPFDSQQCSVFIQSYSMPSKKVRMISKALTFSFFILSKTFQRCDITGMGQQFTSKRVSGRTIWASCKPIMSAGTKK